jgi:hypothetical protein
MARWPLLLPPPAMSTSPSRSRRSSSSIVIKSPSRRSLPSSCHRAVHHRPSPLCSRSIAAALPPSLAVEEPSRSVPCRRGAVAPSLTIEEPSHRVSPSRSHRPVHCCRGAVAPSLAVKKPLAVPTDDSGHLSRPPKPLVRVASHHAAASHLPSPLIVAIAFRASHPSGWLSRLLASHATISHLPAPPPLIAPSPPLVTPISGLSSGWLRRRLSSRRRHLSAG